MKTCRFCGNHLSEPFLDLGKTPLANSYLKKEDLSRYESVFPLRVFLCEKCFLVQLADVNTSEHIFSDEYAYFSSFSESWLRHAKDYTDLMVRRFGLNENSTVVEIASNDGYLLQYFHEKGIPVLGIEPSGNCADVAIKKGIPTEIKFFGTQTARELKKQNKLADLLVGNNVLAHVPDLNDFVGGLKIALKPEGILTMEFPHLLQLIKEGQFDTIYHEHFSYFSFSVVEKVFARHGLTLFDVAELPTHGGSLRIYGRHAENMKLAVTNAVEKIKKRETDFGLFDEETYRRFNERVENVKKSLLEFLDDCRKNGKTVVGYGAPAKGNTLLNYCGIGTGLIQYTVDASPHKQGHYLPGSHLPIFAPEKIKETKPDYVLILPWNLKDEIAGQMAFIREWGGKFVVPIPELRAF
ncbi:MAG: SAM-dependent methyltransferase [Omnitrophica bacterium RIFCSPHIGHO2_02_FULL_51_18]|nr:MAG: SAM-dependent methyltransferase [Omnitrophica bacterium RIFCSPHIGHO2_02_FULL_51_18]